MGGHYFDTPKPVEMIKNFISWFVNNNEIVLDFFAGSSTTAQSILQLNSEDGLDRHFILVQLPEPVQINTLNNNFKTISEIGLERIRRVGKALKTNQTTIDGTSLDVGFRVFKIDSSNMEDIYYTPKDLKKESLISSLNNIKNGRTGEDLLFQVMLELGIELSAKIAKTQIDGKEVFDVDDGYLIACFSNDVTDEIVTQIAKKKPRHAVFRDSSMADDSVAINFEQIFKTYSPNTDTKVL